ncbi:SpoIIE family protein phosphatase [Alkalibacter mobilis]|uniref:SpoIIE family protein phosphatase n=1 Tax=Alkalibacter mobilis TaxID=2787712 RepID=UPI00189CFE2C|nr:SpoIIE family protein phosphatase [Alkalibacter mobilis]MBF7096814.1 SpoIIE family protein phosphatase [Alkalibacter mobilis]
MNYIQSTIRQQIKDNKNVCGDVVLMERTAEYTTAILCDGIGSGIYANIAAIACGNRLLTHVKNGMSAQSASCMVASSMHKARTEAFPFAAFTLVKILKDGHYTIHTYESPVPIVIKDSLAYLPAMIALKADQEFVMETSGALENGDGILIFSDGASQAGMGRGYIMGIGEKRICESVNHMLDHNKGHDDICDGILKLVKEKSGGYWEDDTTLALLNSRPKNSMVVMTGPPSSMSKDREFVIKGTQLAGWKVVCGSSTADLVARELGRSVEKKERRHFYGSVPEYNIEGIDVVSEGALVLNRVYNILDEKFDEKNEFSVVERISSLLRKADDITFLVGNAYNNAHVALSFKEIGVMPRHMIVKKLETKLKELGKIVTVYYY